MKILNRHTGNVTEVSEEVGKKLLNGHYKQQLEQVGATESQIEPVGISKKADKNSSKNS